MAIHNYAALTWERRNDKQRRLQCMPGLLLLKSRPGLSQQSLVVRVLVMSKEGGCAAGGWPGSLLIATEAASVACMMDK